MKSKIINLLLNALLIMIGYLWLRIGLTFALSSVLPAFPGIMIVTLLSIGLSYLLTEISTERWKITAGQRLAAFIVLTLPYAFLVLTHPTM